jgi:hypothetical protein
MVESINMYTEVRTRSGWGINPIDSVKEARSTEMWIRTLRI